MFSIIIAGVLHGARAETTTRASLRPQQRREPLRRAGREQIDLLARRARATARPDASSLRSDRAADESARAEHDRAGGGAGEELRWCSIGIAYAAGASGGMPSVW